MGSFICSVLSLACRDNEYHRLCRPENFGAKKMFEVSTSLTRAIIHFYLSLIVQPLDSPDLDILFDCTNIRWWCNSCYFEFYSVWLLTLEFLISFVWSTDRCAKSLDLCLSNSVNLSISSCVIIFALVMEKSIRHVILTFVFPIAIAKWRRESELRLTTGSSFGANQLVIMTSTSVALLSSSNSCGQESNQRAKSSSYCVY